MQKNFKLLTPPQKFWVSGFLSVNGNGISVSAIMKKLKNGCHFINIHRKEKFQIINPPKVWVSGFPSFDRNGISVLVIMKKLKTKFKYDDVPKLKMFMHGHSHMTFLHLKVHNA